MMAFNIFRYLFKFSLWQPLNVHAEMPHIAQLDTMNGRFKHFTLVKISAKIGILKRSKLIADPMTLHFSQIRRGCQKRRSRMPVGLFVGSARERSEPQRSAASEASGLADP